MSVKMEKQKEDMRSQIRDEVNKEVDGKLQELMGDYKQKMSTQMQDLMKTAQDKIEKSKSREIEIEDQMVHTQKHRRQDSLGNMKNHP